MNAFEHLLDEGVESASEVPNSIATAQDMLPEFDPVREIKRLRQDLAHRLLELQGQDGTNQEESEMEIPSVPEDFGAESKKRPDSLTLHIRRARKMLSRLQAEDLLPEHGSEKPSAMEPAITIKEHIEISDEAGSEVSKPESVVAAIESKTSENRLKISSADPNSAAPFVDQEAAPVPTGIDRMEKRKSRFSIDYDPLLLSNTVLTILGIFVMFGGIGLCCVQDGFLWEFGPRLASTGTVIIAFGLFGRFYGPIRAGLGITDAS